MYIKITTAGVVEQKASSKQELSSVILQEVGGYIGIFGRNGIITELTTILPEVAMVVCAGDLPYNDIATECLRYNSDYIVGDALILKYGLNEYGEMDIVELTQDESNAVYSHLMERL